MWRLKCLSSLSVTMEIRFGVAESLEQHFSLKRASFEHTKQNWLIFFFLFYSHSYPNERLYFLVTSLKPSENQSNSTLCATNNALRTRSYTNAYESMLETNYSSSKKKNNNREVIKLSTIQTWLCTVYMCHASSCFPFFLLFSNFSSLSHTQNTCFYPLRWAFCWRTVIISCNDSITAGFLNGCPQWAWSNASICRMHHWLLSVLRWMQQLSKP